MVASLSTPELEGTRYDGDWVANCTREELLGCHNNWEPEVLDMLKVRDRSSRYSGSGILILQQCIEQPTRWAIHHLIPLPTYVSGRVALLGDAVSCQ